MNKPIRQDQIKSERQMTDPRPTPRWAAVATVDEPAPLVVAMVLHHLAQGAQAFHLFLDRPNTEVSQMLADEPRCLVTVCDDAYWAATEQGSRPSRTTLRQCLNAQRAYSETDAEWLLHCDADEFLADGAGLQDDLQRISAHPTASILRLPVAERVFRRGQTDGVWSGVFRVARRRRMALIGRLIYGQTSGFLNEGMSGHCVGKALVRTGRDWVMGVHGPEGALGDRAAWKEHWMDAHAAKILHFDAITVRHWRSKLLRKVHVLGREGLGYHAPARRRLMLAISDRVENTKPIDDIVDDVLTITARQERMLALAGMLTRPACDPVAAYAAKFGRRDVSAAAMDDAFDARDDGLGIKIAS